MIRSSDEIIRAAQRLSTRVRRRVAVAVAQDIDVIAAVRSAYDDGICDALLVGDEAAIRVLADKNNIPLEGLQIINRTDPRLAVWEAVRAAAEGDADVVMKGFISTSEILKEVLDKKFNLRTSPTLSHVAVLDIPGYHKLMMLTDGGMVIKPDIRKRLEIVKNAVQVGRALGMKDVKVALSAASERVDENMPQTIEAEKLLELIRNDKVANCTVAGPMTFDIATSKSVASKAGIDNPVAGDADAYVVGSIEECNITAKTLIVFARAVFAGVIVGARIPVSVVSRTDPMYGKKTSVALACLIADYYRRSKKRSE